MGKVCCTKVHGEHVMQRLVGLFVVQMYMVNVLCRGPESAVRSSYVQDDSPATLDYPERLQRGRVQKQESG